MGASTAAREAGPFLIKASGRGELLMGARISVYDDEHCSGYREGTIVGVEPIYTQDGVGECLRVMVEKHIVAEREQVIGSRTLMVVDMSIPMSRVKSLVNSLPAKTAMSVITPIRRDA